MLVEVSNFFSLKFSKWVTWSAGAGKMNLLSHTCIYFCFPSRFLAAPAPSSARDTTSELRRTWGAPLREESTDGPIPSNKLQLRSINSGRAYSAAMYRLICYLKLWKIIDRQLFQREHLDNRFFIKVRKISIVDHSRLATEYQGPAWVCKPRTDEENKGGT